MRKKTQKFLLFAALSLLALPAVGQSRPKVDYSGTSEIELSVGLPSPQFSTAFSGMVRGYYNMSYLLTGALGSVSGTGEDVPPPVERIGGNSPWVPTFRLEYGYNVNGWFNVGCGVYYTYNSYPMQYSETGVAAWNERIHTVSVTANVRFYWLNLGIVRMYSGIGAGLGIVESNMSAQTEEESRELDTYLTLALDVRLVGITVGRKVYGRFEAGVMGTGLVTAGIGYRF